MLQVVLDANVIVSGVIASEGAPARILDAWREERFQPVVSAAILDEISRVLRYPRIATYHRWSDQQTATFLEDLAHLSLLTLGELTLDVIDADSADNRYLECAVEGEAQFIVSVDQHLLGLREYQGIRILSPRAFLELLEQQMQSRQ